MRILNVVLKTTYCFMHWGGAYIMEKRHHIKEPGSAITHFIGMLMAIFAAVPLLIKAAREPDHIYLIYYCPISILYIAGLRGNRRWMGDSVTGKI